MRTPLFMCKAQQAEHVIRIANSEIQNRKEQGCNRRWTRKM